MDPRILASGPMKLRDRMLSIPLEQRFTYDEATNHFFVNLERRVRFAYAESLAGR